MEESLAQQYALQVAVQTMKERCLELQRRLSSVEEENMNLRIKCHGESIITDDCGVSEVNILQQKIAQLIKQKSQLTHNILMVATENRHLWNRLSKLAQTNQNLDHLPKINDTFGQSQTSQSVIQSNLIRSKTFTHETSPPKLIRKVESEGFLDTSLEDISLKIINSIAQEKYELEKQCAQMTEMQSEESCLSNSIGFAFPNDELDDCTVGEIASNMERLIVIKDIILMQREKLKKIFEFLQQYIKDDVLCKSCERTGNKEKELARMDTGNEEPTSNMTVETCTGTDFDSEKICPVCSKLFVRKTLDEFIKHVQSHFIGEDDILVENFEVIQK